MTEWVDKLSLDCNGNIRDFNGNIVNNNYEVWNGYHGHCIVPKGTFEKIWNDEENEDIF